MLACLVLLAAGGSGLCFLHTCTLCQACFMVLAPRFPTPTLCSCPPTPHCLCCPTSTPLACAPPTLTSRLCCPLPTPCSYLPPLVRPAPTPLLVLSLSPPPACAVSPPHPCSHCLHVGISEPRALLVLECMVVVAHKWHCCARPTPAAADSGTHSGATP